MLNYVLGEDKFGAGLKHYFAAHAYGNVDQDDLYASMQGAWGAAAGDHDLAAMMRGWTSQRGHPVVNVRVSDDGHALALTQHRFVLDSTQARDRDDAKWWIPFTFSVEAP